MKNRWQVRIEFSDSGWTIYEGFKNEQKCFEHIQDYKNSFPETFVRALIRRYWIRDNGRLDKELVKYIRKEDL